MRRKMISMNANALKIAVCSLVAGVLLAGPVRAGLVNDIPSCYQATRIAPPEKAYDHLLYVLMDQTIQLDPSLEQSVVDNVMRLLAPGTKFVITKFSAYSQKHYLAVLHTGILEKPLDPSRVSDTSIEAARKLTQCLATQRRFAERMALSTMVKVLKTATSSLDHSDILQALTTIAPAVTQESAPDKILFLVSDGLENSSVANFYARGSVRLINPEKELAKAKKADLIGDFGGARVFVLGGAMMPPPSQGSQRARDGYRDPQSLRALSAFWHEYFKASNANLIEFGEPSLVNAVSFR